MTRSKSFVFQVNGQRHDVAIDSSDNLADVLRDDLELCGTKVNCVTGDCGACTVLVEGYPVLACLTFAATVAGSKIMTIEGLADCGTLHPLQRVFLARGLTGCGTCISGILLSAASLLAANPRPTRDDVRLAFAGHTCRCFGYMSFVEAVLDAAQSMVNAGEIWA